MKKRVSYQDGEFAIDTRPAALHAGTYASTDDAEDHVSKYRKSICFRDGRRSHRRGVTPMKSRYVSSLCTTFTIVAVLAAVGPSHAAYTLGDPASPVGCVCGESGQYVEAEITEDFDVVVRNCSGGAAGAFIYMVYGTPGGERDNADHYGSDELRIDFSANQQEIEVPIPGIYGGDANVVTVWVTGFLTSGGNFDERKLGEPARAYRFEDESSANAITLTSELEDRLRQDLKMRALVNPQNPTGNIDCARYEINEAVIDNRGREHLFGMIKNKVICTKDLNEPQKCGTTEPVARPNHAFKDDFMELPPESFRMEISNNAAGPGQLFDVCCDPGHATEAVVMCANATIDELMVDGVRRPLTGAFTVGWIKDVRPIVGVTPEAVTFGCQEFPARGPDSYQQFASEQFTGIVDDDNDLIADDCDHLILEPRWQIGGPSDDPFTRVLRHRIRNKDFNATGATFLELDATTVLDVQANSISVIFSEVTDPSDTGFDALKLTLPTGITSGLKTITVFPDPSSPDVIGTDPAPARNNFSLPRVGFVSVRGSDYLHPFDELSGEFVDLDPEFDNSVPELPDSGPNGVAFSMEPGNENKELYIAAGSQVFVYDDPNNELRDLDGDAGVQGASVGPAVGQLALDPHGEFAFAVHGGDRVGVVQVQKNGLDPADRFAAYSSAVNVAPAIASDLVVKRTGPADEQIALYIGTSCRGCQYGTQAECPPLGGGGMSGMMDMMSGDNPIIPCNPETGDCGGEGGGGGGDPVTYTRTVAVAVHILQPNYLAGGPLLDPSAPWTTVCERYVQLSEITGTLSETEPWPQIGMDFSSDGSELFVVDPEGDSLFIVDTATNELKVEPGLPIPVGIDPFDVEVVDVLASGSMQARAYVVNHGSESISDDDSMTIVNTTTRLPVPPDRDLDDEFTLTDLEVETVSGTSAFLYLMSPNRDRLLIYDVRLDGDNPQVVGDFIVGPLPRRVAARVQTE
jgi:hypothetical protein